MKPSCKAIRTALAKHAEIELEIFPEDLQIDGNASAIDEDADREIADDIRAQLESGNECAWCVVVVKARWCGFTGTDSLGACSYPGLAALREDLFESMKQEALIDLAQQVATSLKSISELIKDGAP